MRYRLKNLYTHNIIKIVPTTLNIPLTVFNTNAAPKMRKNIKIRFSIIHAPPDHLSQVKPFLVTHFFTSEKNIYFDILNIPYF